MTGLKSKQPVGKAIEANANQDRSSSRIRLSSKSPRSIARRQWSHSNTSAIWHPNSDLLSSAIPCDWGFPGISRGQQSRKGRHYDAQKHDARKTSEETQTPQKASEPLECEFELTPPRALTSSRWNRVRKPSILDSCDQQQSIFEYQVYQ